MNKRKMIQMTRTTQRGDTLIEVMLALAVIGMTIGLAYGIANRATRTGQDARERTQATSLAQSQLENLKLWADENYSTASDFCVTADQPVVPSSDPACIDGFYNIQMEHQNGPPQVFKSIVTWDTPNSEEDARVELLYRP